MKPRNIGATFAIVLVFVCSFLVAGCRSKNKGYVLRGEVLEKNIATNEITVNHEDIPNFMPAMTMPYKIKDPVALLELQPGDRIAAQVVTANDGKDFWLENVHITDKSGRNTVKPSVRPGRLQVGQHVLNLPLINQDGATLHLDDFRGKAVLVTFIYTRCPMPTFCPRLSSQFAAIHDNLVKTPDVYSKTHLLTISFDPKYDSSAVLRKYGLAYLNNDPSGFAHWDFAVAAPGDLRKLADSFGLEYFEEDNQIAHTMSIALIAPNGTVARYWANEWTTAELEEALRQEAGHARGGGR